MARRRRHLPRGHRPGNATFAEAQPESWVAWCAGKINKNRASHTSHMRHGFREVGRRERIARMTYGPYAGQWRATLLIERRSGVIGQGA